MRPDALYALARQALFRLDAETAHELTIGLLSRFPRSAGLLSGRIKPVPCRVMGLDFPNPVGLAAGLDKNGACIDAWAALGFGFVEVGTVTPRPQPGNPKPRMFRIESRQALINRLGFNNHGVDALIECIRAARYRGILGINIGKNFDTPIERAGDDYRHCLEKVYPVASYVTVNISSPNTQGLRELQKGEALDELLTQLKQAQTRLADRHGRYVPLAVKIAPDMETSQLRSVADALRRHRMDAVIATNTTTSHAGLETEPLARETGGLSGTPLFSRSTAIIGQLRGMLAGELPIIGVGGILSGADARAKRDAGASLVQIYTGFIYRGPALIRECVEALR
ncbi:MAG: quinone-dependent dihydroorotate dehydrogenase [Nevskiales bacterium]